MKIIIEISDEVYQHMMGNDLLQNVHGNICYKAVQNGTPIPDNATNGDVIKALYPKGTTAKFATFMRFIDGEHYFNCSEEWWNASYQKGGKG